LKCRYVLEQYLAQATNPSSRWYYYLGQTLLLGHQHAAAAKSFEKAATLSSSAEAAAWALFKAGEALYVSGNVHGSKQALLSALHLNPGMPEPLWLLSYITYNMEEYVEAGNWARLAAAVGCYKGTCASASRDGYR
jgi:tetratricopeptide (TPR) repeat protein